MLLKRGVWKGEREIIIWYFKDSLSGNSQGGIERKQNKTKYREMTRKPRSHVIILIYRRLAISVLFSPIVHDDLHRSKSALWLAS